VPGASSPEWDLVREWTGTLADLAGSAGLLGWDRETLMPAGGADGRARMLGTLAALRHREMIREDAGEALAALAARDDLDDDGRALVRLATRDRDRALKVPEELVRELSEACSRGVSAWVQARAGDDFPSYAGPLARVVELKRREAEAVGVGDEPYDSLLEDYEPGARVADLEPVFAELRARLTPLVAEAAARPAVDLPPREWAADGQMALAHEIARLVGFDESCGVIAQSAHPFTSSPHRGDVRFTTRLMTDSPIGNISAVLHELGHALYEQGFPGEVDRTPLYDAPSLGAHESQSRFWENQIGHTRAFWERIEPAMRRIFPDAMSGLDAGLLHRAAHRVTPSLIRVEADEVTYNLHIVLRFGLELALLRGDLQVPDLPGAFSDGMQDLLGIRPPSDALGAMQDIHWADGLFGYFPTYSLGNLYAAQLAEVAEAELGGLERAIAEGRFADILAFMRDRVHRHGARMPTGELMRRATGADLSADPLIAHLERSYLHH
jgi:carboxypeptidase Taq